MRELVDSATHTKPEDVPEELRADTLIRTFDVWMLTYLFIQFFCGLYFNKDHYNFNIITFFLSLKGCRGVLFIFEYESHVLHK